MAGTNRFYPFAPESQNLLSDAQYEADAERKSGSQPGNLARSELNNKALKQATTMAAAMGQLVADSGMDADDGDVETLSENLKTALKVGVEQEETIYIYDCTCSYNSGTKVFTLTPQAEGVTEMPDIFTARFLTTAAFPEGGTFQILGETFTPKLESSDDPVPEGAFLAGRVITLNFQRGGGAVT